MNPTVPRTAAGLAAVALGMQLAAGCGERPRDPRPDPAPEPARDEPARPPAELADTAAPPDADVFLPALEGYVTEEVDPGELRSSLDHGAVPHVEVRRRLILDERGFTSGEVAVVTFDPAPGAAQRYLEHRWGEAPRTPVRIGGVEMIRVEAEPHGVLAWTGPTFAVTFERGQERSEAWLEELARATVEASGAR